MGLGADVQEGATVSVLLGDVHVDYRGADEYTVRSERTRARVHTSAVAVAMAIGRAIAVAEGLVGGVVGSPCECPVCSSVRTHVTDSRPTRDIIWRRRRCKACGQRWTTEERTMAVDGGG